MKTVIHPPSLWWILHHQTVANVTRWGIFPKGQVWVKRGWYPGKPQNKDVSAFAVSYIGFWRVLWCAAHKNCNAFPVPRGFIGLSSFDHFLIRADKWTHSVCGGFNLGKTFLPVARTWDVNDVICLFWFLPPCCSFWPCKPMLVCSSRVQHYFLCRVSEAMGSRTSLDPAEHKPLLCACPWSGGMGAMTQRSRISLQWVNTALRESHDSEADLNSLKELSMWQRVIQLI